MLDLNREDHTENQRAKLEWIARTHRCLYRAYLLKSGLFHDVGKACPHWQCRLRERLVAETGMLETVTALR